ncbi:MAG: GAF domain-containing protein [Actinobacteria bacterium]|nr:MAG: GAF domain-containing protein [Actinomycetota bacterium]
MAGDRDQGANGALTEEAKRLRLAETLIHVSRTVAAMETLDEVLRALVELTARETDADRGTLFLHDAATGELYSRVAQGQQSREIRIPSDSGIAGHVFQTGEGVIVEDAYSNPHFNPQIDEQTGYVTRSIACAPVRLANGTIIGVAQVLNKRSGKFEDDDLALLEAMTAQAATALKSNEYVEHMQMRRVEEHKFLELVSEITSELDLSSLLQRIMGEATRMLKADRSTLFLNDEKTGELFARVAQGDGLGEIRFPNTAGIAGTVFQTGESINIPYAYADLRFNPQLDKQTGYFTRSILCVPVVSKDGRTIGVTQVLNKRGGPFTGEDEQRLKAFTAQVSIALQNAKLFDDVQNMKNYNDAMLESMSNGILTLDEDGRIATCNAAGARILRTSEDVIVGESAGAVFAGVDSIVMDMITRVEDSQQTELAMDVDLPVTDGDGDDVVSVNLTVLPLVSADVKKLGTMVVMEDISGEKRVRSTMARYMDPGLADQLVRRDEEILGGKGTEATILFSDIRNFTTLSEELGPPGTVAFLNEYFTLMVECIQEHGGMLDKFIGDAIMAAFGLPIAHGDDPDRAVRSAIGMITSLFDWNKRRASEGKKPIDIGIGINTDMVVAGNIGSPKRMDFTMIGDGVNLASRLESACKQYSARILISEHTLARLKGVFVKGKTEPVAVYEVLDYHTDETFPNVMDAVNQFRDGIAKYRRGDWGPAILAFGQALQANPSDKLSQTYIQRCEQLLEDPPDDWSGVWILTAK